MKRDNLEAEPHISPSGLCTLDIFGTIRLATAMAPINPRSKLAIGIDADMKVKDIALAEIGPYRAATMSTIGNTKRYLIIMIAEQNMHKPVDIIIKISRSLPMIISFLYPSIHIHVFVNTSGNEWRVAVANRDEPLP